MKKTLSLLLAVLMLLAVMTGCGTTASKSNSAQGTDAPASKAPAASSASQSEPDKSGNTDAPVAEGLPICEETTDFSVFMEMSPQASFYVESYDDTPTWKYLESLTNVHLDWQTVADNTMEKFNIMIASEPCDLMIRANMYYTGGVAGGIDEGVFMDLTDVVEQYMPTYNGLISKDKETKALASLSDGRIGAIWLLLNEPAEPNWGPIVRADWLDKIGMNADDIITYDDYYDMLTAFKVECGASSPLLMNAFCAPSSGSLVAGYGVYGYGNPEMGQAPFYVVDGQIKYGYMEDGFYEYLQMLHKWYAEGLFNSDFATNTNVFQIAPDDVTTGDHGLWYHMAQIMDEHMSLATDPEFRSCPIRDAVKKDGDTLHFADYTNAVITGMSTNACVSAECENVDILAKWMDFLYTEQGSLIVSFGIEGETYDYGEDGKPHFTDKILNNPDYGTTVAANLFAIDSFIGLQYNYRYTDGYSEVARSAGSLWLDNVDTSDLWSLPGCVSMSAEDALAYSAKYNDIATFGTESVAKFVTGETELTDDNWKAFTDKLESMGIQECIGYWQNAYDAFYSE